MDATSTTQTYGEDTMVLCDGTEALVRPISPDDGPALMNFHRHLSGRSHFPRYFSRDRLLRSDDLQKLTCVDGWDHVALVVEANGDLIALGRYDRRAEGRQAEVAFAVADTYQQQYIASELLCRLAHVARMAGVSQLTAEVQAENAAMLSVFREAGYPVSSSTRQSGSTEMKLDIVASLEAASIG